MSTASLTQDDSWAQAALGDQLLPRGTRTQDS